MSNQASSKASTSRGSLEESPAQRIKLDPEAEGAGPPRKVPAKRIFKACHQCRAKKIKCDLGDVDAPSSPPCKRCSREGQACTFEPGRRGEARRQKALAAGQKVTEPPPSIDWPRRPAFNHDTDGSFEAPITLPPSSSITLADLQNSNDALAILARAAEESAPSHDHTGSALFERKTSSGTQLVSYTWQDCKEVQASILTGYEAQELLNFFFSELHEYAPFTCRSYEQPENLSSLIGTESFLLSSIMMIASRYHTLSGFEGRSRSDRIHLRCWEIVRNSFSRFIWSAKYRTVGTVEALLILSEWAPKSIHYFDDEGDDGPGAVPETNLLAPAKAFDDISDMCIANAIRIAQMLELNNPLSYSLDQEVVPADNAVAGRRLKAWLVCIQTDRNHSVRLAKEFTTSDLTAHWRLVVDTTSASLSLVTLEDRTTWKMRSAFVELICVVSRVHQILGGTDSFVSPSMQVAVLASVKSELKLFETKYRKQLEPRHSMRAIRLSLEHHYVRLYSYAYSLQSLSEKETLPTDLLTSAAYPFILECVDAAQQVIEIVIDDLQKLLGLKQAPAKVWLRLVYAATVLLKATCTPNANLVSPKVCLDTINRICTTMDECTPDDQHLASRYSFLLRSLLHQVGLSSTAPSPLRPPTIVAPSKATEVYPFSVTQFQPTDATFAPIDDSLFSGQFFNFDTLDLQSLLSYPDMGGAAGLSPGLEGTVPGVSPVVSSYLDAISDEAIGGTWVSSWD